MKSLFGLILALPLAIQDSAPVFIPGEITPARWIISGPADLEDETEVHVRARRVMRRWDAPRSQFTEADTTQTHLRTAVVVNGKRFSAGLKAGPAGRYRVALSTEEKQIHSERLALGPLETLFTRAPDDVKVILEVAEKGVGFLTHIERVLQGLEGSSAKHRDEFHRRVGEVDKKIELLVDKSDLSGTIGVVKDAYFHIRNAQVWEQATIPTQGDNDPARLRKKVFTDLDMTIEALRKLLGTVPDIASHEIKVSTTMIVERLIAQAGTDERRRESVRSTARAASRLAESAPTPDKDLVRLLDLASDRATDPAEIGPQLRAAGLALLVQ